MEVVWLFNKPIYQIVIDRSRSLKDDNKMEDVKNAAKAVVQAVELGKYGVGIISFSGEVTVNQSVIVINTEEDRNAMLAVIDSITADTAGGTAIGAASRKALDDILACTGQPAGSAVFLITDGLSNTGESPYNVINSYKSNNIPIFTFGYSGGDSLKKEVGGELLSTMADNTNGKFRRAPDMNSIVNLINETRLELTSAVLIKKDTIELTGMQTKDINCTVDSTIGKITFFVNYKGEKTDLSIKLFDQNDNEVPINPDGNCTQPGAKDTAYRIFTVDNPAAGDWRLLLKSNTTEKRDVFYSIDGTPKGDGTAYSLSVQNISGENIQYPQPMLLTALFNKDQPIAGAKVTGTIKSPDGKTCSIEFRDDGKSPDYSANDGRYCALFSDYTENGQYVISVSAKIEGKNKVYTTYAGTRKSSSENH